MSYLTKEDIAAVEEKYGKPVNLSIKLDTRPEELADIRSSQKNGRAHDITMFIFKGNELLFNAKHFYPPGLFRAPSGAAKKGEGLIAGGLREAFEETGAKIEFEKYLLRVRAEFTCGQDTVNWTSHVFRARYLSGEIKPVDTAEIREARFVKLSEIPNFNRIMREINSAGFRYRIFLTNHTLKLINKQGNNSIKG